jgi:energy-coupling factor transporter ATP-binding protein EcfA2
MLARQSQTVFLSYSVADQRFAKDLASVLGKTGMDVWWDLKNIPIGADWIEFLLDKVATSVCTVVLWSRNSVKSEWVMREATAALRRKVLCPVLIEDVAIPETFARIQAASLIEWDGDPRDSRLEPIVRSVLNFFQTAPSSAQETRVFKQSQRSAEVRAQELFQQNLRSESRLEHIEFKGTPLYGDLSWNLNSSINILLGRNGYGKSYLLRTILSLLQYNDDAAVKTLSAGAGLISLEQNGEDRIIQFSDQFFVEDSAVGKLPVLAIPDTRFMNRSLTTLSAVSDETTGHGDRADLGSYGAWHFLQERPFDSMIQSFLYGLCLDYFDSGLQFNGEQFNLVRSVVRELTDQTFDFDRVAREGRDRFTLYVRTEGNESATLPIQKASQGTLSVIAMFGLIYEFLRSLRQETSEVRKRSGIVIIDEVDAHLHPVWQQKIVGLLRRNFPRAQFIITAHNPIAVAGCLEDEVSVLRKEQGHGFNLVQFPNDFVGWQTEEIYRKVFEIEKPDDTFVLYDALRPFKAQLEEEAQSLVSGSDQGPAVDQTLDEIQEKLLYIGRAEEARSRRLTQEEMERENRALRERVMGLESSESSAKQQEVIEGLKIQLKETGRALEASRRRTVMWATIAVPAGILFVLVLAFVLFIWLLARPK